MRIFIGEDTITINISPLINIQNKFTELSELFQDLCIPYLLTAVDENGIEKLDESEKVELNDKYEQFKLKIRLLCKKVELFFKRSKGSILIDYDFVNHIDTDLYESVSIFEQLDANNLLQLENIKNAHAAFIMLARLLNTSINIYNDKNPNNTINQLHNIPDPQFYEINNVKQFYTNFILELNKQLL